MMTTAGAGDPNFFQQSAKELEHSLET